MAPTKAASAETAPPPSRVAVPAAKAELPPTNDMPVSVEGKGSLVFKVVRESQGETFFSLGVRKSGSTMLHKIVSYLAHRNSLNVVDVPGTFFRNGMTVADWAKCDLGGIVMPGNVYLGFRSFPAGFPELPHFSNAKKIFMFRDPRDALISQYYSDAYSHGLPSRETETGKQAAEAFERKRAEARASDIETYAFKRARGIDTTLLAYAGMLNDPTCLTLRYEDYVFQKKRLIHKILVHFGWTCLPGQVEALLKSIDVVPETEDSQRFVRRVIPGDHRNKLSPDAIRKLNTMVRESLRLYDYY